MLPVLLAALAIPRLGPGRARTRPEALLADKAYSSRAHRALLRRRGIKAVIPQPADQIAHRKRRGSRGGRPVSYDRQRYKNRNVIERGFNTFKQWRGLASRYDKLAVNYRGAAILRAIIIWASDLCVTP
jgi:transposase